MGPNVLAFPPELKRLLALSARLHGRKSRSTLYLVGGAVRDRLRSRPTFDLDLACDAPEALARALAARLKRRVIVLDQGERVFRVTSPEAQIDVAAFKGPTIEEDLRRRDFTIDAMAAPLSARGTTVGPLLDPCGGRSDLAKGLVRANGAAVFDDDPLRLLRAFRVASQLGFSVEDRTLGWIKSRRALAAQPAGERLQAELMRLLESPDAARWLKALDDARLLTAIVPELEASRRCALVYYGAGGVLKHSLLTVERLDFLLGHLEEALGDLASDVRGRLGSSAGPYPLPAALRLAALLHDVAKPPTAKRIGGRLRFFGHEELGATMAGKILDRLRFPTAVKALVQAVIGQHLRPGNLAANPTISDRAVFRFYEDLAGRGVELLLVCWSDHSSYLTPRQLESVLPHAAKAPGGPARGVAPAVRKTLHHLQVVAYLLRQNYRRPETVEPPRLADGNDVMKLTGLKPGPRVGELLQALREAQAEGRVRTRKQALDYLRRQA